MTPDVHILDPCTSDEWLRFINSHPDAGIFHHPAWMRMLRDIYGYRMFAVCMRNGRDISAGIPFGDVRSFITGKRWVSLPFSDHCRPLVSAADVASTDVLIDFLRGKQGTETDKIELRWPVQSSLPMFHTTDFVLHTLALEGKDEASIFRSFNQQVQRSIKKAEKEEVEVRECSTLEEFDIFYRLQVLTRKRLGVPAQPKEFFAGVWEYIIKPGLGVVLLVFKDATPIGAGIFFRFNKTMFYKYGASDLAYKSFQPNYAFMWSGIKRALAEGCTTFDFGRSDKDNDGLRRFKLGWATEERALPYAVLADRQPKSGPSVIDGMMGKVIRNAPTFVCTKTGELLYKHFA